MIETYKKYRDEITEYAYIVFFCLLFFAKGIGLYDGQKWFYIFLIPAVVAWIVKMAVTRWRYKEVILVGILLICGAISWRNSGDLSALVAVMTIVGIKDVSLDKLWKIALPVWTIAFWGAVVLSLLGLWPTVRLMHKKGSLFILRDSLGMTHPNVLFISYIVFVSLLFLVFRWRGRDAVKPIIWTIIGGAFIFMYAFSYTGLMCLLAFVVLISYFCFRVNRTRIENILLGCIVPFCVIFSLGVPLIMGDDGPVYDFFYKVFNTRFYMTRQYLKNYQPSIFGQRFSMDGSWSVDCSYTYGWLAFGVILWAFVIIEICRLSARLCKSNCNIELAIVLSLCVAGIMEPFMFNFSFKNLIFPLLGWFIFNKDSNVAETKDSNIYDCYKKCIDNISRILHNHKRIIMCLSIVGIIIGGIISSNIVSYPQYIIIDRDRSDYIDYKDNYEVFGDLNSDIIDDSWIIGFDAYTANSTEQKCYVFDGQPIQYITNRSMVTYTIFVGIIVDLTGMIVLYVADKKKS